MKQFFKIMFASALGVIIASVLGIVILFGILGAIASSSEKSTDLQPNSVYEIKLKGVLVDRSVEDPLSGLLSELTGGQQMEEIGLDDILNNIERAKNNPNIVGIYLNGGTLTGGMASFREIRNALEDFKKSNKFIVAYADVYEQKNYYLASVADKLLLNPQGMIEWKGLSAELMFLKNTLDKLGVDMQVIKVGTFKSAVEPFVNTEMSDANRLQTTRYMNSLWDNMLTQVSASRKINKDTLNAIANQMMLFQPTELNKKYHLADSLVYVEEVDSILRFYAGNFEKVKHSEMSLVPVDEKYQKDKLAIIYAVGGIDDGGTEGIVSEDLVETIEKVTKDDKIKSVVLRVSSPGGSAYGSEQIWHALQVLKAKKTLIVSMGDYAASGGYYISCMADTIVAQPNTLTGSIGIFGLIPNLQGLNKKLGFTYDVVKTNQLSDAVSLNRPFSNEEKLLMQNYINRGYDLFVKRCADGRGLSNDSIRSIAEGRVWTGEDAIKIGLVDVLGGLNDAIQIAAQKAKITDYQVKAYPEKEDFATRIMKSLEDDVEAKFMEQPFGREIKTLLNIQKMDKIHRVQARLPYFINIQ